MIYALYFISLNMAKDDVQDLLGYLLPFPPDVQERFLWLRDFVWELYPQANELIYNNHATLGIGWSVTEKMGQLFCTTAIYRSNKALHFGCYYGATLADPEKQLLGNGNQYRYILVPNLVAFPEMYMKQFLQEAYEQAMQKVKDPKLLVHGKTILKGTPGKD